MRRDGIAMLLAIPTEAKIYFALWLIGSSERDNRTNKPVSSR
jgi:hypothetical protein